MIAGLVAQPRLDWSAVELFHMDEYVGLAAAAPAVCAPGCPNICSLSLLPAKFTISRARARTWMRSAFATAGCSRRLPST